jgi:peptide chain release factor 2
MLLRKLLKILGVRFDISSLKNQLTKLEKEMIKENFWNDSDKAQIIVKEAKNIEKKIKNIEDIESKLDDVKMLCSMAIEENDTDLFDEISEQFDELKDIIEKLKMNVMLDGEFDHLNAIVSINSGSGGLDAQDWAQMLLRMYTKWAESQGYEVEVLDILSDRKAGIKSVTIKIIGEYATGYLKSEKGVHRLVRISPFDTAGKRHTSFASVDVVPELDDTIKIEIDPSSLRIDTYRASGAGGQHINKTDSAVRITHLPTNIVVQCQNERSQLSNKRTAMKMLMAKLIQLKEKEKKQEIGDLMGDHSQITWGSQIRSYVFHPYSMVKDHRTNYEVGDVNRVIDGYIDGFINEYLKIAKDL